MGQDRSQFKKMRRHRHALRFLGARGAIIGGFLSILGIIMLLDSESTLLYNGVEKNSFSAKLQYNVMALSLLGISLFFLLAKPRVLNRFFVLRQGFGSLFSRRNKRTL